jgi:hypothetical protein
MLFTRTKVLTAGLLYALLFIGVGVLSAWLRR